ncbi:MAG: sigma-54-dependent Fis family transcriptional regulator [Myxococcales bacterium FL481]|nr:MAG: sigma-54-dependent Fis family transcriptional regulator [Myxococcales bacterium FL481]
MSRILIIDDEDKHLELCRRFMPEHEFVGPARNYVEAAQRLGREKNIELVLLDVHFDIAAEALLPEDKGALLARDDADRQLERLRRAQGLHILDRLRRDYPDLPVLVMTSRDDLPLEADAERLNAEDYTYLLDDDYLDARSLRMLVEGILARRHSEASDEPFYWGSTRRMQGLRRRVGILARGQLPIIILGATGTGKSLLAREFIHRRSGRSGPFVAVDLSTVPADLMAAHLFGVVKGAYTGATATRDGMLARAHQGTLFLDEIGNLSLELQRSLLLVLQEHRYRPVGAVEERVTDVKIVVATNENLAQLVREGRFREDLYMRLNPATAVTLPSLRERRDDFQRLLEVFIERVCLETYNQDLLRQYADRRGLGSGGGERRLQVTVGSKISARAEPNRLHFLLHPHSFRLLSDFDWPGNFRQFEMVLSNLVTFTLVDLVDLGDPLPDMAAGEGDAVGRPDVVPIPARTVTDLLRPWERGPALSEVAVEPGGGQRVELVVRPAESLNAVSCDVERQYLEQLYHRCDGELAKVAEMLIGDPFAGRKIQLRMNQLGIKLRSLKRVRSN